jgi:hypothetical protein
VEQSGVQLCRGCSVLCNIKAVPNPWLRTTRVEDDLELFLCTMGKCWLHIVAVRLVVELVFLCWTRCRWCQNTVDCIFKRPPYVMLVVCSVACLWFATSPVHLISCIISVSQAFFPAYWSKLMFFFIPNFVTVLWSIRFGIGLSKYWIGIE